MRDTCDIPCHSRGRCICKVFLKVSVATQKSHIDLSQTVINRTSTIRVYVFFRCFPTINAVTQPRLRWVIKALCLESYPALLIPFADFCPLPSLTSPHIAPPSYSFANKNGIQFGLLCQSNAPNKQKPIKRQSLFFLICLLIATGDPM